MVNLREVWAARELLWVFAVRDIKVIYKQTFFGFAWALVVPLIQVVVFSLLFGVLLGVNRRVDEVAGRQLPYPLFALTGQIVWNFFRAVTSGASNSLLSNAAIVRKVYVPRLVLPLASLGRPLLDMAVAFVLMSGLTVWYVHAPGYDVWFSWKQMFSVVMLIGCAIPALGVGLVFAAVTVFYRDLRLVLPFLIQMLFFLTPVIYPPEILPEQVVWLIYLNPMAGFVQAHRACVLDLPIDWLGLAISVAISLAVFVFGLFYFTRAERHFADVV